jgi:hypothetical protein
MKNNNKIKKKSNNSSNIATMGFIALILSVAIVVATTQQPQAAYGQEGGVQSEFDTSVDENASAVLIDTILATIQNMTTIDTFAVHEDGRLYVTSLNGTPLNLADDIRIDAYHPFTPENGYVYRDNNIYAPNGTELFK